jgi:hypothetical protein
MNMYTLQVAYEVDVILPEKDGEPMADLPRAALIAFGAKNLEFKVKKYTGAGEHEWVGSQNPALRHLQICVKCTERRATAADACPGIPE